MNRDLFDDLPWGQTVNIASGNAVVGQQIGDRTIRMDHAECYAWLRDEHDDLWLLVGARLDRNGGLYALGGTGNPRKLNDLNVSQTGPVVWVAV